MVEGRAAEYSAPFLALKIEPSHEPLLPFLCLKCKSIWGMRFNGFTDSCSFIWDWNYFRSPFTFFFLFGWFAKMSCCAICRNQLPSCTASVCSVERSSLVHLHVEEWRRLLFLRWMGRVSYYRCTNPLATHHSDVQRQSYSQGLDASFGEYGDGGECVLTFIVFFRPKYQCFAQVIKCCRALNVHLNPPSTERAACLHIGCEEPFRQVKHLTYSWLCDFGMIELT